MKIENSETCFFICLFGIELIFHYLMFGLLNFGEIIRFISFSFALVGLFSLICHKAKPKTKKIVYLVFIIIFSLFALVEMQFSNFIGHFYSFNAVGEGFGGVKVFIPIFVRTIKPQYWLIFLPLVLYIYINFFTKISVIKAEVSKKISITVIGLLIFIVSLCFESNDFKNALKNHESYDIVIKETGINAFLFEDLFTSFLPKQEVEEVLTLEIVEQKEPIEEVVQVVDYNRYFDDSKLKKVAQEETNETFKQIDEYILSRPIERKNEKTGIYEDYNFIYFMVESLDYIAIDEKLTPTLYKMYSDGYSFLNHYTPIYVCGTGDSEWAGMTGSFPTMNECVAYNKRATFKQSLATLFKNKGYDCLAFHNWDDQFYPRTILEPNYGFDAYYDQNDLKIKLVDGWLSDEQLVEKALPYFIDSDHFFAFIITSTMHFPYDEVSYYGNKYLDEISKVHSNYPLEIKRYLSKSMEFDKALQTLLEQLEAKGKLDKTVISIYGDHHPKTIASQVLIDCCETLEKSGPYATDLLPFIIYCPSQKGEFNYEYCCNVDQLPTIANMFNLNYDPRLYIGHDIFSKNSAAIFPNGDFITSKGMYHKTNDSFEDYGIGKTSEYYWQNKNAEIQNMRKINQAMTKSDYYRNNDFVVNPIEANK